MYTYEDLLQVTSDTGKIDFVHSVIFSHKNSKLYNEAYVARDYFRRRNTTISQYQKLLYTLSGEAVPDNFSANYQFCNAFFHIFVTQEVNYLLGNGVTFENDATKDKLGGDMFDNDLIDLAEASLWGGVAFGFFNLDHIDGFDVLEFAPLIGEEDGALHAGVRFWQIDDTKPYVIFDPEHTWKRKTITNFKAVKIRKRIFDKGELCYEMPEIDAIKNRCKEQLETLWDEVKRFENPHTYYVDLSEKLWECKQALLRKEN